MRKTRFAPWLVFACIGTLVGCTSSDQGSPSGNTELNVVIPFGSTQSGPSAFDIQLVEYTINCSDGVDFDPTVDPNIDSGPTLDNDVILDGVLEVLPNPLPGVNTQDYGPDLDEVYVFQGFMDLPPTRVCSVQLRARVGNEVVCTSTETFDISPDGLTTVNVLMFCDISYQAPVGMLDLNADFSFNVSNYCPDLFVLNCLDTEIPIQTIAGIGQIAATGCQVRYRDADSTCGNSCDPQECITTPEGLTCTPGPDEGVSTNVVCPPTGFFCAIPNPLLFGQPCDPADTSPGSCVSLGGAEACAPNAVIDCTGTGTPAASCDFTGDVTGNIGGGPPGPLNPGPGGFFVACVLADDDGDPATPEVPLTPGATIDCIATTTDGDMECNKQKVVSVQCPGLSACQEAGPDFCDDGNDCTSDVCDDSSGAAVCINDALPDNTVCTSAPAPATCQGGVCTSQNCNAQADPDGSCDDGNECTVAGDPGSCLADGTCDTTVRDGASCAGGTGTCDAGGACIDNCVGADCSDGNPCTDDVCTSGNNSFTCTNPANDSNSCTTCGGTSCVCESSVCVPGCTVPAEVDAPGIPMACRNSFNDAVSTFPIDLLNINTGGDCILQDQEVNFALDPVIALDTAFLEAAAQTLCDLGTFLTEADVTSAQVSVDAIAGATCTEQLSELSPVPQTVTLDITLDGTCGAGGTVTVNTGISVPLPALNLPCTAGARGEEVQICSTGQVPLAITLTDPAPPPAYTQTYVGVSVGEGGAITVAFACNTSSTTNPPPGSDNEIGCVLTNPTPSTPDGLSCEDAVGAGNVGETPFPVSDCNTAEGGPTDPQTCDVFGNDTPCSGTCDTVPVGVDPSTVCGTFTVE